MGEIIIKRSFGLKYFKTIGIDVIFYVGLFLIGSLIMFSSLKGIWASLIIFLIGLIGYSFGKYFIWKVIKKHKSRIVSFIKINFIVGLGYYILLILGYFGLGYIIKENALRYYFTAYFLVLSGLLYYFLNKIQIKNLYGKNIEKGFKKIYFVEIGVYFLLLVVFIFYPLSWVAWIIIGSILFVNAFNRSKMIK